MTEVDSKGLGRVVSKPLREVWKNEATEFTPWLAENLDLLMVELGIDEVVDIEREVAVGEFKLDLLCTDADGRRIAVENQLERSDHSHLGQSLLYAAGLGASLVVWVTPEFRDDHRKTLEWLNEHTDDDIGFFGVHVSVIAIGESPPAPVFDVVVEPNDWGRQLRRAHGQTSPVNERRRDFYAMCFEVMAERDPGFRNRKPQAQNWNAFRSGPFGNYAFVFGAAGSLRVEVYLDLNDEELPRAVFDALEGRKDEFQDKVPYDLTWEPLENRRACRISVNRDAPDLEDPDQVAEAVGWASSVAFALIDAFDDEARRLVAELQAVEVTREGEPVEILVATRRA